ncbi:hypothetical protein GCM10010472_57120 [Pseudonocardia halophobica]|uniref:Uncharacterized protein n=1 Tax=Pseudonocardia halophobica TaxID=29401 RepID=A0A9W6L4C4_9PSEU|nr:hypothetical protein GCM10017577_39540 [Pseudonocardia halophobica]
MARSTSCTIAPKRGPSGSRFRTAAAGVGRADRDAGDMSGSGNVCAACARRDRGDREGDDVVDGHGTSATRFVQADVR